MDPGWTTGGMPAAAGPNLKTYAWIVHGLYVATLATGSPAWPA